eukprot:5831055-Karenia_brevis.AAC.2
MPSTNPDHVAKPASAWPAYNISPTMPCVLRGPATVPSSTTQSPLASGAHTPSSRHSADRAVTHGDL